MLLPMVELLLSRLKILITTMLRDGFCANADISLLDDN